MPPCHHIRGVSANRYSIAGWQDGIPLRASGVGAGLGIGEVRSVLAGGVGMNEAPPPAVDLGLATGFGGAGVSVGVDAGDGGGSGGGNDGAALSPLFEGAAPSVSAAGMDLAAGTALGLGLATGLAAGAGAVVWVLPYPRWITAMSTLMSVKGGRCFGSVCLLRDQTIKGTGRVIRVATT